MGRGERVGGGAAVEDRERERPTRTSSQKSHLLQIHRLRFLLCPCVLGGGRGGGAFKGKKKKKKGCVCWEGEKVAAAAGRALRDKKKSGPEKKGARGSRLSVCFFAQPLERERQARERFQHPIPRPSSLPTAAAAPLLPASPHYCSGGRARENLLLCVCGEGTRMCICVLRRGWGRRGETTQQKSASPSAAPPRREVFCVCFLCLLSRRAAPETAAAPRAVLPPSVLSRGPMMMMMMMITFSSSFSLSLSHSISLSW
jgi:hypothetical protein